jgi:hypothetical protein
MFILTWGQVSYGSGLAEDSILPHPRRFFRRRTIHRLPPKLKIQTPTVMQSPNHEHGIPYPSQPPLKEHKPGPNCTARLYIIKKASGKRHLAGMSGQAALHEWDFISERTVDSRVFRRFLGCAVRCRAEESSGFAQPVTDIGYRLNQRLPLPRSARFWRITLKAPASWAVERSACPHLFIYRDAGTGRGKRGGRRKGLAFGQPSK